MKNARKLLSILLILAVICVNLPLYKITAQTIPELVSEDIVFNEYDSLTIKYNEPTVYKINMTSEGSFILDLTPFSSGLYGLMMSIYDEQGHLIDKYDSQSYRSPSINSTHFNSKTLKSGIYYLSLYTKFSDSVGEYTYFGTLYPSKTTSITINIPLKIGKTIYLGTEITGSTDKKVYWKSSKPSVATVSSKGKVKAIKTGSTTVKAYTESGLLTKIKIKVTK